MAARDDKGIIFKNGVKNRILITNNTPWNIVDIFVLAPAFIFTELRTITDVTGIPPIRPEIKFPYPCASNSRFEDTFRFNGSILETASRFNKVSSEAIIAIVIPTNQTFLFAKDAKEGKVKIALILSILGMETKCFSWMIKNGKK